MPGENNPAADPLSHHLPESETKPTAETSDLFSLEALDEHFAFTPEATEAHFEELASKNSQQPDSLFDLPAECFDEHFDMRPVHKPPIKMPRDVTIPLSLKEIKAAQLTDPEFKKMQNQAPHSLGKNFENAGQQSGPQDAWTLLDPKSGDARISAPQEHVKKLTMWCHAMLTHPGTNCLHDTLDQHCTWPNMMQCIQDFCKVCLHCQQAKRRMKGWAKVPLKDIESQPWKDVCADLSGPWKATVNGKEMAFHALTLVDPFASWVETVPIKTKQAPPIRDLILNNLLR